MKSIVENQKKEKAIEAGLAFRQAYNYSKGYKTALWGLTFLLAIVQFLAVLVDKNQIYGAYLEVFVVSILALYILLSSFGKARMRYWKDIGCKIQELHDFYTLDVGNKPSKFALLPSLIQSLYKKRLKKNNEDILSFSTWWSSNLEEIDFPRARLICVYSTFSWELELRKKYQFFLIIIISIGILIPIAISIVMNFTARDIIIFGLVPIVPFISLVLEELLENIECIKTANSIRTDSCHVWDNVLDNRLNVEDINSKTIELMSRWQIYRLMTLPIFEWLYKLTQQKMNNEMLVNTDSLIEEVKELDNSI
ncbi:S-4TM family putative pore-forming effector [Psychrobacter sp. AH5]|uniref:S-4TM family putative pore-forming effector n=1 Tax=Psychrobacter sp. AH5 TaxID=2937433 RepID=UPI003340449D